MLLSFSRQRRKGITSYRSVGTHDDTALLSERAKQRNPGGLEVDGYFSRASISMLTDFIVEKLKILILIPLSLFDSENALLYNKHLLLNGDHFRTLTIE